MQSKLAQWSLEDPNRRFDRLLRLITNRDWLQEAAGRTLESSGAHTPGLDGVTKVRWEAYAAEELERLRVALLDDTYRPQPARRVYIPKPNGKQRPLGIPCLRDRIVQRAMLMAMDPIWESDFLGMSYGFRRGRSVHHAVRAVKLALTDTVQGTAGRWVIEGDLASYFDTVHHRLLMKAVKRRIGDPRFLRLLWRMLKGGLVDHGLFRATHEGVPQGGVLSPLLSNIMLHEFDQWMERHYCGTKAKRDRWQWNDGIARGRPIALREQRLWRPAVSYYRYADDFIVVVKGNRSHAEQVRLACRDFLEETLKLTLNMDKTIITHVDDGFTFLGHRIIRKRGPTGRKRPVTTIPRDRYQRLAHRLTVQLSTDYAANRIDLVEHLNAQLTGWANFYQYTDYTSQVYTHIDQVVFWKLAHWMAHKFQTRAALQLRRHVRAPEPGQAKTWVLAGRGSDGRWRRVVLRRLVSSHKGQFRWHNPPRNPYVQSEIPLPPLLTSQYRDVAFALGNTEMESRMR